MGAPYQNPKTQYDNNNNPNHKMQEVHCRQHDPIWIFKTTSDEVVKRFKDRVQGKSTVVSFIPVDLSSQSSVRTAAATINARVEKIDLMIKQRGCYGMSYEKAVDGIERQFATNHVGHFLLTNLLMEKILKAAKGQGKGKGGGDESRIVSVSSSPHYFGGSRFEDVNFEV
ncbi:MAG: hypothetical protein M1827_000688 [Pycnora praestabilis]|nr:MAG: hypothetical protein M1827_000688 [Pycnora praestabilis]